MSDPIELKAQQLDDSRRIYNKLYPPPKEPDYNDDPETKSTINYLWVMYTAAVTYSGMNTIPSFALHVEKHLIIPFLGLTTQHVAGVMGFMLYEVGLTILPYILFRFLTDSQEGAKLARVFMRKSFRYAIALIALVLVMQNVYASLSQVVPDDDADARSTPDETVLASTLRVEEASEDGLDLGLFVLYRSRVVDYLVSGMWITTGFSTVMLALVIGIALALMKAIQSRNIATQKSEYVQIKKEHNDGFIKWDALEQRYKRGVYSLAYTGVEPTYSIADPVAPPIRRRVTQSDGDQAVDDKGRLLRVRGIKAGHKKVECSECHKVMASASWVDHPCRWPST